MPLRGARSLGVLVFFWAGIGVSLAASLTALSACERSDAGEAAGGGGAPLGEAGAPDGSAGEGDAGPRRPSHRYYMGRTKERCEVYTVEADVVTQRGEAPCPAYIEVGERIRLSGFTCQREGTPGREQPVVCPGDLLWAERDDRAALSRMDAGSDAAADAGADAGSDAGSAKARPKPKKP